MFNGRKLIIATKHKKESVIAPILEKGLGVRCFTDETFDTDTLGTFTERLKGNLTRLQLLGKMPLAMELNKCDLGVASEGSFGAHPTLFYANADDEFLIFIDKKNNIEIVARELSMETNFNGSEIKNENDLLEFAESVKFPSHGLILRKSKAAHSDIIKGITKLQDLKEAFHLLYKQFNGVYVETDMRAMYNPSRMTVIENATKKLVAKVNSCCPQCNIPGFGVTDAKKD